MFSGGNADIPYLWGSQNGRFMQTVHFGFSIGALVSPMATAPFLSKVLSDCQTMHENSAKRERSELEDPHIMTNSSIALGLSKGNFCENITSIDACAEACANTRIHYAFLIAAVLLISASVGFIYIYFRMDFGDSKKDDVVKCIQAVPDKQPAPQPLTLPWKVLFLTLLASLITTESIVEESFPNFFMKFGISYMKWNLSMNVIAITVFWVAFGVGRFCGIFIVLCCKNTAMLMSFLFLLGAAFSIFLVSTYFMIKYVVFSCVAAIGFSMSVIFPAILSWTSEEVLPVSGNVSGLFMTAASLGGMVFQPLIGNLMEKLHPMWFVYILTITVGVALILFVLIKFLLKVKDSYDEKECSK